MTVSLLRSSCFRFKGLASLALLLTLTFAAVSALSASAQEPDPMLLKIKGYSPELIRYAGVQRSRQEWKEPPPPSQTPMQRVLHNIYYSKWTDSMDAFGSTIIRDY
jgi:hypothetical protein